MSTCINRLREPEVLILRGRIKELEAANNSVRVCKDHVHEITDPLMSDCLICRIEELEAKFETIEWFDGYLSPVDKMADHIKELEAQIDELKSHITQYENVSVDESRRIIELQARLDAVPDATAIGRIIYLHMKDSHMVSWDWDRNVILGADNLYREKIMKCADDVLAALGEKV